METKHVTKSDMSRIVDWFAARNEAPTEQVIERALSYLVNNPKFNIGEWKPIVADCERACEELNIDLNAAERIRAAAPDLLAALQELVKLHDDCVFVCGGDDEQTVNYRLDQARAALEKARA